MMCSRFSRSGRWTTLVAVALLAACGEEGEAPPRIVLDHSACAHCAMLISEPAFAAAYRIEDRERLFDDLGCLLAALATEPDVAAARVWVHDFESGRWLDPDAASFVHSPALHTPMGGGLVALGDRAAAEQLAARTGGRIVGDFAQLLRENGDAG